ncbi:hypothetical protein [Sulfobacillus harzensis]
MSCRPPRPHRSAGRCSRSDRTVSAIILQKGTFFCPTPYWPDMTGAILCVEDDETTNVATVDRYLTQLRQMGVYQQIAALVVGRFPSATGFSEEDPPETVLTIAIRGGIRYVEEGDFYASCGHWQCRVSRNGVNTSNGSERRRS